MEAYICRHYRLAGRNIRLIARRYCLPQREFHLPQKNYCISTDEGANRTQVS